MENTDKKKALFEALEKAEEKVLGSQHKTTHQDYNERPRNSESRYHKTEKYKNKNSIFKTPSLPIKKCLPVRRRPDYEVIIKIKNKVLLKID